MGIGGSCMDLEAPVSFFAGLTGVSAVFFALETGFSRFTARGFACVLHVILNVRQMFWSISFRNFVRATGCAAVAIPLVQPNTVEIATIMTMNANLDIRL